VFVRSQVINRIVAIVRRIPVAKHCFPQGEIHDPSRPLGAETDLLGGIR
jgi:hypothetical protein